MRIIALTGKARSGKDTVAEYLERYHGFTRYAFADPMRAMVHALEEYGVTFPADRERSAIGDVSERQMLQDIGALGRTWGPCFWITLADRWLSQQTKNVVISDIRTEQEATWVRMKGGEIWHITRPDAPEVRQDVTEQGIENPGELVLNNDGTFDDLYDQVDDALDEDALYFGMDPETYARWENAHQDDGIDVDPETQEVVA